MYHMIDRATLHWFLFKVFNSKATIADIVLWIMIMNHRNHGGAVPLLFFFLISVFEEREPRLFKVRKHHSGFPLAACCISVDLRWWKEAKMNSSTITSCYLISSSCWDRCVPLKIPQIFSLFPQRCWSEESVTFSFVLALCQVNRSPCSLSIICRTSQSIRSYSEPLKAQSN